MICPKCKSKVSEQDTTCPKCKLRLVFKCPRCGSPTRLGSVSCKKCSFTFVKFCPSCHSANFASSSICRKCGAEFTNEQTTSQEEKQPVQTEQPVSQKEEIVVQNEIKEPLLFYVDFLNLDSTFEKYDKNEFKQKVIDNIKTTVKIAFGVDCEFINSHTILFKYNYSKHIKILDKISQFELEFEKFNKILQKSLNNGLTFKFAIATIEEVRKNGQVPQLKYGGEKDIIVSNGAYAKFYQEF